jgi:hypothetical protein
LSAFRTLPIAAGALLIAMVGSVHGQALEDTESAPVQIGPVALWPSVRLTNVGFDNNVFGESDARNPTSDVTATVRPTVDALFQLPRVRVSGRSELDFVYYNELDHLRSIDTDNRVRLDFSLGHLNPYVAGSLANTRHRRNYEIDSPVQRRDDAAVAGVALRLTGKTSIDIRAERSRTEYEPETVYFESDLARLLNRRATAEGATFRYAATPLTTIGIDVHRQRDRFEFTPERDSNRLRVSPLVEFSPHALLSGRAAFGFNRRTFLSRDAPQLSGMFVLVDLRYTLLGRTLFTIEAERDIGYSYRIQEEEYQLTGFAGSVTHRLADSWDVRARIGRYRLAYITESAAAADSHVETVAYSAGEIGYVLGRMRVGLALEYTDRTSNVSIRRTYDRVRVVSSLTYVFD